MKTIKISKVHYEMLVAAAKKSRQKPEVMIEELIHQKYQKDGL